MLFGLGAIYIAGPSFGTYWLRALAAMVVGVTLILASAWLAFSKR